jgi:acyl-[acyl-carrier-protein]-phospholipid O-acyltransferase/long-chain-fatty-acid--[acyl-carrier-protein] ligase
MADPSTPSSPLLLTRRFAPLFWCQFFSAFSDNFLKTALGLLIVFHLGANASLNTLTAAVFIFPYFLLSGIGGEFADRHDKAWVIRRLKFVEIGISVIAVIGFALQSTPNLSLAILFLALFLFGVIGSLFGPIKYGILPDHLQRSELPAGNALVEGATFIAILLGTSLAGFGGTDPAQFSVLMIVFSLLCWISSLFIPATGEAAPDLVVRSNVFASTWDLIRHLRDDSRVWWGAIVSSWFWLVGAVVLPLLSPMVKDALGGTEHVVTACLGIFAVSIAIGSGLAAWLAAGRIVLLPTLIGAVLLGLFSIEVGWATFNVVVPGEPTAGVPVLFTTLRGIRLIIGLTGMAIGAGLFIVPTFAAVQAWAGADRRARVVAGVNVVNAAFMAVAAVIVAVLQAIGMTTPALFLLLGAGSLLVAVAIGRTMPASALSDALSIIYRALFRIEVRGLDNLHKAGPNVIIALNHVSFLDAGLAMSLRSRKPVFAIDVGISKRWWVKPFLRLSHAIPLDPSKPMATRTLINAVKGGEALIIFPEGRITVTGSLMKVYDGAALIADKSDAEVVPVRIEGLEQTPFSRLSRSQVRRRWFPKVRVTVLEPVKLTVDPALKGRARRQAAGAALYAIMSDLVFRTTSTDRTIIEAVIEAAEVHGRGRIAIEDPLNGTLTYSRLLTGIAVLGAKLETYAPEGKTIGVMLPNANAAAVTVLGLMSAGRVPAMINFTAGATNILAACRAAQVDTILTSRTFVEKGRFDKMVAEIAKTVTIVYLEDVGKSINLLDKLRGLWRRNRPLTARKPDDWAAILFTSGSEGMPKGVVLSHRNMLANAAQARARIDYGREDKVFNVLPVFHSFGLTIGLVLPLVSGVRIYLYPSPLHYRMVPELIYGVNATILFATDTFLAGYARSAHAYDFRSLRYILAGAEPVKESTRQIYLEKFGLRILEGYGVTETAPAIALNTPMFNKFGTVGRMLPGMEARLEKVEGVENGGRLVVRGPNVMIGYLKSDRPGVLEPPPEGWYDTGDIVAIDDQGFIAIKGRAKRFAKIGGEMISLAAVEALAGDLWPQVPSAVVAVPDARKGERLVLATEKKDATRAAFMNFARSRHAADLMIPSEIMVLDKLPLLGSGKVDLLSLAKMVKERLAPASETMVAASASA